MITKLQVTMPIHYHLISEGFKVKHIYIVEGINDCVFLNKIISAKYGEIKCYSIDINKDSINVRNNPVFNTFIAEYSPYDILIISETGKSKLLKLLHNIVNITLNVTDIKIIILFDLDSNTADEEFKNIEKTIKSYIPNSIKLDPAISHDIHNATLHQRVYRLTKRNVRLLDLNFLAFNPSLESAIYNEYKVDVHKAGNHIKKNELIERYSVLFSPDDILLEL